MSLNAKNIPCLLGIFTFFISRGEYINKPKEKPSSVVKQPRY